MPRDLITPTWRKLRRGGRIITIQNNTIIRVELPLSEAVLSKLFAVLPCLKSGSIAKKHIASTQAKIVSIISLDPIQM